MTSQRPSFDPEQHRFWLDGKELLSVTRVLRESGIVGNPYNPETDRDYYLERGSAVHLATQYDDQDELDEDSLDEDLLPYLEAWRAFRRESGFDPVLIEEIVWSETHGFAGILDRAGILNGKQILIDIKTGSVPKWAALQTAAYALALGEPVHRYTVELRGDGKYSLKRHDDRGDAGVFLAALQIAKRIPVLEAWKRKGA